MVNVNLIRWRSIKRHHNYSKLIMNVLIGGLVASLLVGWFYHWIQVELDKQIISLNEQNLDLERIELPPSNLRIKISDLTIYKQQYSKIKAVLFSHYQLRQLFEVLDRLIPKQVVLTELQFHDDKLRLTGVSLSDHSLSDFLDKLSRSPTFVKPQLTFSLQDTKVNPQQLVAKTPNIKRFNLHVLYNSEDEV
ncbi:PilN domain-containing protein [uncultured Psychrosphaera sp.]|uniref:PilN domain-containing protein n=1 Tax=uncultured Psychrosphaera sp. TaxID=1403522 RepID=UPI0030F9A589